ncbi:MAG: hypothetical protein AABO58_02290, partial [Acidobacteriota bacterium]
MWRLEAVRRLDLPARIAVAFAAGALITGAVMTAMSIAHVQWSRTVLVVVLGAIVSVGLVGARGRAPPPPPGGVGGPAGGPRRIGQGGVGGR